MTPKLERYLRRAEQAEQAMDVSLDNLIAARISRMEGSILPHGNEEMLLQRAAEWAAIYTACKLIIAEETGDEALRRLEEVLS